MKTAFRVVTALALMVAPTLAQQPQPEKNLSLSVTVSEFNIIWDALGEEKAKKVFNIMVKLNNQALPQFLAPQPQEQPKAPGPKVD